MGPGQTFKTNATFPTGSDRTFKKSSKTVQNLSKTSLFEHLPDLTMEKLFIGDLPRTLLAPKPSFQGSEWHLGKYPPGFHFNPPLPDPDPSFASRKSTIRNFTTIIAETLTYCLQMSWFWLQVRLSAPSHTTPNQD